MRVKEQLVFQMEQVKRESEMKVRHVDRPWLWSPQHHCPHDTLSS